MSRRASLRAVLAAVILAVGLLVGLLAVRGGSSPAASSAATPTAATALGTIRVSQLPKEARDTIALIAKGGPYPYKQDGTVFPESGKGPSPKQKSGFYREYTVKTPGASTRGARRIVTGGKDKFYTSDHYKTFKRIIDG